MSAGTGEDPEARHDQRVLPVSNRLLTVPNVLSIVRPLLQVLPPGSRRFLLTYGILTAALALLDLVALGLVGTLLQSVLGGGQTTLPLIGDLTATAGQVAALVTICVVIVLKGAFAVVLLRMATRRFARHEVAIGDRC